MNTPPKYEPTWEQDALRELTPYHVMKSSGTLIHPATCYNLTKFQIDDIAHSLSRICRWAGDVDEWMSVSQHSVIVSEITRDPELKALVLMHDASEAYLGDIAKPIKRGLNSYMENEDHVMQMICERFKLPFDRLEEVKLADLVVLVAEARDLFSPSRDFLWPEEYRKLAEEYVDRIKPVDYRAAERLFLERASKLGLTQL